MHYRIQEVATMLGISPQTLRFYEKYGILPNARTGDGRYRQYANDGVDLLMTLRKWRNCGFTVAQTADLLMDSDYDQLATRLDEQAHALLRQAEMSRRISGVMQESSACLRQMEEKAGCFEVRESPAAYALCMQENMEQRLSTQGMERIGILTDWLPLLRWGTWFASPEALPRAGFIGSADTASFLGITDWPDIIPWVPMRCMYALWQWPSVSGALQRSVSEALERLGAEGYRLTGQSCVITMGNHRLDGSTVSYGEIWFPIQA